MRLRLPGWLRRPPLRLGVLHTVDGLAIDVHLRGANPPPLKLNARFDFHSYTPQAFPLIHLTGTGSPTDFGWTLKADLSSLLPELALECVRFDRRGLWRAAKKVLALDRQASLLTVTVVGVDADGHRFSIDTRCPGVRLIHIAWPFLCTYAGGDALIALGLPGRLPATDEDRRRIEQSCRRQDHLWSEPLLPGYAVRLLETIAGEHRRKSCQSNDGVLKACWTMDQYSRLESVTVTLDRDRSPELDQHSIPEDMRDFEVFRWHRQIPWLAVLPHHLTAVLQPERVALRIEDLTEMLRQRAVAPAASISDEPDLVYTDRDGRMTVQAVTAKTEAAHFEARVTPAFDGSGAHTLLPIKSVIDDERQFMQADLRPLLASLMPELPRWVSVPIERLLVLLHPFYAQSAELRITECRPDGQRLVDVYFGGPDDFMPCRFADELLGWAMRQRPEWRMAVSRGLFPGSGDTESPAAWYRLMMPALQRGSGSGWGPRTEKHVEGVRPYLEAIREGVRRGRITGTVQESLYYPDADVIDLVHDNRRIWVVSSESGGKRDIHEYVYAERAPDPYAAALRVVGRRWTPLVIRSERYPCLSRVFGDGHAPLPSSVQCDLNDYQDHLRRLSGLKEALAVP